MRRRHIAYAAAAALLASLVAGCSADMGDPQKDEATGTGSISLSISDPSGSRTILPSGVTGPAPSAYLVGGTGPDGEDLTRGTATAGGSDLAKVKWKDPFAGDAERQWFVTDKTSLDVKGVHQGEWDLRVVSMYDALGEDGTFAEGASRIAKGQTVKRLSAAGASATVALDRLVRGDEGGTLPAGQTARISLTWDKDQVETPVLTVKAKYQGDGTEDSAAATFDGWFTLGLSSGNNTGKSEFTTKALPAGAYTVLASITEKKPDGTYDTLAGTADVVRILENRQSAGTIPLTIGLVTNEYTLALKDMTMRPIEGEIIVSGSSAVWYPDEDSFNALASTGLITVPDGKTYGTMTKDEIDQVLDASNLTYLWTIDGQETVEGGQQVEAAGNNVSWSGVAAGEAALQVVVGSGLLGSLGSTGVTITPGMIEFRWPDDVLAETGEAATKVFVGYEKASKALSSSELVTFPYLGSWDDLRPVYADVEDVFDQVPDDADLLPSGTLAARVPCLVDAWRGVRYLALPASVTTVSLGFDYTGLPILGPVGGLHILVEKIHLPSTVKTIAKLASGTVREVNLGSVETVSATDSIMLPRVKEFDFSSVSAAAGNPLKIDPVKGMKAARRIILGENVKALADGSFQGRYRNEGDIDMLDLDAIDVNLDHVTSIGTGCLALCKSDGTIRMNALKSAGDGAFSMTTADSVSLPELTVAPMNFMRQATLRTVDLPKLEETGKCSFMSAQIAGDIEFPKLTKIGDGSFVQGLFAKVTFEAMTTREEDGTGWLISARVKELDMPELTTLNVPFGGTTIDTVRMPKLTNLGKGGIAGSIKRLYLGSLTDLNCSRLVTYGQIEELHLDKLKTITRCPFGGLEIGTLYVPLLESIGHNVFAGCTFTKGISFPKLKTMGASNFCGMSIPGNAEFDELTDVGSGCFGGFTCEGSFSVPKLKRVGSAFSSASIGDSVSFQELVEINGVFLSGSKVADLYLPASLTTVCSGAVGGGWTEDQTIHVPFAEGKLPSGWASDWLATSCKAKVVYGTVDGSAL